MVLPGWDSFESVSKLWKLFTVVGLASLGLVALFDILAWVYSNRKDALAELRTASAQDALKRNLDDVAMRNAPRILNGEYLAQQLKGGPKGPVEIWYAPNDTEAFRFAEQIYRAVSAAEWTVSEPIPIPQDAGERGLKQLNAPPAARFSGAQSRSGLTVLSSDPDLSLGKEPKSPLGLFVDAIGQAMNAVGHSVRTSGFVVSADESVPDGVIRVVVEPRQ
jgi:hypothetical protein